MKFRHYQQGLTFWELAVYIGFIGFILTGVMKLGPHYIDDNSVTSAIEGVHQQLAGKDIYEVTNADIKGRLSKFFDVDMISTELLKSMEVVRDGGKVLLVLNYEVREPFMGNVDAVMNFQHEVDLSQPAE
jgi:hypothetical protein